MSIVFARAQSTLPMSVGTGLAFESFLGIDGKPKRHHHDGEQAVWINLSTLVRNLLSSIEKGTFTQLDTREAIYALTEEVLELRNALLGFKRERTVMFYWCKQLNLTRRFPNAVFRNPNSVLQIEHAKVTQFLLTHLVTELQQTKGVDLHVTGGHLMGRLGGRSTIFTHEPVDLLSRNAFSSLRLLESYTGTLKSRAQWHTKLQTAKNNPRIPFNTLTLTTFGDGLMFRPKPIKLRNELLRVAEERKWNAMTSSFTLRTDIRNLVPAEISSVLLPD